MTRVFAICVYCQHGCPKCIDGTVLIPEYPMTEARQLAAPADASGDDDETVKRMARAIELFVCQPGNKQVRAAAWKEMGLARWDADRLDGAALQLYRDRMKEHRR